MSAEMYDDDMGRGRGMVTRKRLSGKNRTRSTACWASTSPTTTRPSAPASARSSIRRWSPTSACRCSRSCSTAWCADDDQLRNFTSDNVEVSLDNITSIRFGDYLNSIPLPAMLSVFKAEEWDNSAC
jgi:hypothetical protein